MSTSLPIMYFDMKKSVINVNKMKNSHTMGFNPLPKWCVSDPNISPEVIETVSKTWQKVLTGDSKLFIKKKKKKGKLLKRASQPLSLHPALYEGNLLPQGLKLPDHSWIVAPE